MTLRIPPAQVVSESTSPLLACNGAWPRIRLGEVATILNGFAFKSGSFRREEGMPLLRIRDVGREETETRYVGGYDQAYVVHRGDIIVGMDGDFRAARWSGDLALLNQRVCRIEVDANRFLPEWLLHLLPGYLDAISARTSAITVKHLSSRDLLDLPLPFPPLDEQRRIVQVIDEQMSRLDSGVKSVAEATKRLTRLRREALNGLLGGRLEPAGLPRGWSMRPLADLVSEIGAGKSFKCLERPARSDEWGVIKVSAMTWGRFDERENKTVMSPEQINPNYEIRPGDLLLSRANTVEYVGAAVYVERCRTHLLLSDKSMRLRPVANVDPRWLGLALGCASVRTQIVEGATGTSDSMRNISQVKVGGLRIPTPPTERQTELADKWSNLSSQLDSAAQILRAGSRRSNQLRAAILAAAFTGRLVLEAGAVQPTPMARPRLLAGTPG